MKKIYIIILIITYFFIIKPEQEQALVRQGYDDEVSGINQEKKFITIGLGSNCGPAMYTRLHSIRTFAFPFDWCVTPYEALYNFITTDFKNFLQKRNLVPTSAAYYNKDLQELLNKLKYTHLSEGSSWVFDKEFGMIFIHDFPDNTLSTIDQFYELNYTKYIRRIERFYNEINSKRHIYFIRFYDITKQQSLELLRLLQYKFPKTDFTLIVIGDNKEEFSTSWNVPHVKNFYSTPDDGPLWQRICSDISLGKLQ